MFIVNTHSKPFLISTWYRPPSSNIDLFDNFEIFIQKGELENKEIIVLGDFNGVIKSPCDTHTKKLLNICTLYQLKQFMKVSTN